MTRVTYHLAPAQIAKLKELARTTGLSVAELIRRAIDVYLASLERKDK